MTQAQIISSAVIRGGMDTTVGFYTDAAIDRELETAHKWAAGYHKWPMTEYMDKSGTFTGGTEEYAYPNATFKTDSIRILKVGSYLFDKKEFTSYLRWREDNSSSTDRVFSDYGRQLYINPNCASGTIYSFGQQTPAAFSLSTDTSVFSGYDEEGDEAIVCKLISLLKEKAGDRQTSIDYETRSRNILDGVWQRIQDEQAMYQAKDKEMFERIDIVSGGFYEDEANPLRW